jgi:hypothetical protein
MLPCSILRPGPISGHRNGYGGYLSPSWEYQSPCFAR